MKKSFTHKRMIIGSSIRQPGNKNYKQKKLETNFSLKIKSFHKLEAYSL